MALAGCAGVNQVAGLTQIQDTITKFDQSAHTVSISEIAFLRAAQTADCNYQFYARALAFVSDPSPTPATSMVTSAPCVPQLLTDQDISIRRKLLRAVTLYADQVQAIASGGADKSLANDAESSGANFNKSLKSVDKRKLAQGSIPAYVEAAANALFSVVMDADRLKDIKAAASAAGPDLVSVVDLLKSENTQVAANMTGKAGSISVALDAAIAFMKSTGALTQVKDPVQVVDPVTHKKVDRYHLERTNDYRVLLDVIEARGIVQSIDSLGLPAGTPPPDAAAAHAPAPGAPSAAGTAKPSKGVVTCKSSTPRAAGAPAKTASTEGTDAEADTDGDADIDSDDSLAKHINSTLDALVAANNAIADATPGCLKAAVSDLAARAQAVQSIASAIKK